MRRRYRLSIAFLISLFISSIIINVYSQEISNINASLRIFLMGGGTAVRNFGPDGIPRSYSPRIDGHFTSPFYVVHYGLIYSDNCASPTDKTAYHWLPDRSRQYWPFPPAISNVERFRTSADWILKNIRSDASGNFHLFYDFDWPYLFYPDGKLVAPWWSGLTDAHAITLLLRAADCFGGKAYLNAATSLYKSVLTPVSQGGSLVLFDGYPWIEEYVDPRVPDEGLSKVFNGMVYAYHGIRGYEEYTNTDGLSDKLLESIHQNISKYDLGYWTRYDNAGSISNIKYNYVTYNIILDDRIYDPIFDKYLQKWRVGIDYPGFLYPLYGSNSIDKMHFIATFFMVFVLFLLIFYFALGLPMSLRRTGRV